MHMPENVLRVRLENVYFLWGRGKTTIANLLMEKSDCAVYRTDEARARHARLADPAHQPTMCRDFEKEYGVSDFWALPPEVIASRETLWLQEFTPMAVVDLLLLADKHKIVLCEGDLDHEAILPLASHCVYLLNCSSSFDWFDRPDHRDMLASVNKRTDLAQAEKDAIIQNAYRAVAQSEAQLPEWVSKNGIRSIAWDERSTPAQTAAETAQYFGF